MHFPRFMLGVCFGLLLASVLPARGQSANPKELLDASRIAFDSGDLAAAESLAVAAEPLLVADPASDPLDLASARLMIATTLNNRRFFKDGRALDAATKALETFERLAPENDPRLGDTHHALAAILKELNRAEEALPHVEKTLALRRATLGPDHDRIAHALYTRGSVEKRTGRTDAALASFRECLEMRLRLDLPNDKWVGSTRTEIADLLEIQGNFDEARTEHEAALREHDARLVPNDPTIATALQRYAGLVHRSGNVAEAIDLGQRAVDVAAASPGYNRANLALLRGNLAAALVEIGDHVRSRRLLEEALPVFLENLGPNHRNTIWCMSSLAFVQGETGDSTGAIASAQAVRQRIESDSTLGDRTVLSQVLVIESRLTAGRDLDRAIELAKRAEAEERARPEAQPHRILLPIALQAELQSKSGDEKAVAEARRKMAEILDANHLRGTKFETITLGQEGLAEWHLGDLEEAVTLTRKSSLLARNQTLLAVRGLPDRQSLTHATSRAMPMTALLEMATLPDSPHAAAVLDEMIHWRGLVAAEVERRRPPRGDEASAAAEVHAQWVAAQRTLAQAEVRLTTAGDDPASVARVDSLRVKAEEAERLWSRVALRDDAGVDPERVGLEEVRGALRPGDALVSVAIARRSGTEHLIAFVVRGDAREGPKIPILDFGTTGEVATQLSPWLELCSTSPRGDADVEARCRKAGLDVRKQIWDPIAKAAGAARNIYIVPEGAFHTIPWNAFPDGDGYLVERDVRVHVLEAERDLLRKVTDHPGTGLLAVGGVDFDGMSNSFTDGAPLLIASSRSIFVDCPDTLSVLLPLPGTDEEIRSIESVWEETTGMLEGTSLPAEPVDVLRGVEASEEALKLLAPGHRVLHLATHGIVLGDACMEAGAGTRGVGGLAPVDADRKPAKSAEKNGDKSAKARDEAAAAAAAASSESPWLGRRVYLALAGANHALDHERDDNEGFLTAEEVATLDLRGTEWVVLSACQSGVAAAWEREGLLGMRRAFRMAGARAVIASQWPVEDVATLEWMTALYQARAAERSTTGALQKASRDVLASRRTQRRSTHPFYWAAFGASGM